MRRAPAEPARQKRDVRLRDRAPGGTSPANEIRRLRKRTVRLRGRRPTIRPLPAVVPRPQAGYENELSASADDDPTVALESTRVGHTALWSSRRRCPRPHAGWGGRPHSLRHKRKAPVTAGLSP